MQNCYDDNHFSGLELLLVKYAVFAVLNYLFSDFKE